MQSQSIDFALPSLAQFFPSSAFPILLRIPSLAWLSPCNVDFVISFNRHIIEFFRRVGCKKHIIFHNILHIMKGVRKLQGWCSMLCEIMGVAEYLERYIHLVSWVHCMWYQQPHPRLCWFWSALFVLSTGLARLPLYRLHCPYRCQVSFASSPWNSLLSSSPTQATWKLLHAFSALVWDDISGIDLWTNSKVCRSNTGWEFLSNRISLTQVHDCSSHLNFKGGPDSLSSFRYPV